MNGYEKFFRQAKKAAAASKAQSPEDVVREHLASRAQARKAQKQAKQKSRQRAPVFASLLLLCSVSAGIIGFQKPEAFEKLIHTWNGLGLPQVSLSPFATAAAESSEASGAKPAEARAAEKSKPAEVAASGSVPAKSEENLDIAKWTPEELSVFKKLNDRKAELDRRESEIVKLEEELQKQQKGIEDKIKQLEDMRKQISETLKGRVEQDQEKVAKLVDVYSNMKPSQASKVIESLNEDLAVSILEKMKKKNAAEILNTMAAPKAKKLSEMLTGYRRPAGEAEGSETKPEARADASAPN